ncbi:hypothetical protein K437DRAFT_253342 [Tilletiaria anomala UBC 951]|uniref:Uncharacterized protein n=1 Tax=Tilletiaria anomala (strain ATCC 24038 / CBS 436.72 / UBC 951) TaxID=1037660 RepID=A0A066WQL8_TILAU|nr:uncharacterized protein K437DRAFT_253342 [Tilletiaria anomala UBC 951]KDN53309.1 hypothetical protein K437DRAFT_253342 [Tilletiaria anomala UBC 951]
MADVQPPRRFSIDAVIKPFRSRKDSKVASLPSALNKPTAVHGGEKKSSLTASAIAGAGAAESSETSSTHDAASGLVLASAKTESVPRRVSFSPSVEEAETIKEQLEQESAALRTHTLPSKQRARVVQFQLRRSSKEPTAKAAKQVKQEQKILRASKRDDHQHFVWKEDGIHKGHHSPNAPKAKVTNHQAVASRHARLLEQLMNGNPDAAKAAVKNAKSAAKKETMTYDKAQAAKAKQLKKLKSALLDIDLANSIIGELRVMQVDPAGAAVKEHGMERVLYAGAVPESITEPDEDASKLRTAKEALHEARAASVPPTSTSRMVCLDCDESTASNRHADALAQHASTVSTASVSSAPVKAVGRFSIVAGAGYVASWLPWAATSPAKGSQTTHATNELVKAALPSGKDQNALSLVNLPQLPEVPTLMGVSPISLIISPKSTIVTAGADKLGAFNAMASITGAVIEASGTNVGLAAPIDRMSIFVHWWGFEVTLPPSTISYLGTAQSVSGSFLGFLQTMAVSGGIPELVPFIRYISMFVDVEFKAIAAQNKGNGVVIAAVWAFPMALVPRPWDFAPMPPASAPAPAPVPTSAQASGSGPAPTPTPAPVAIPMSTPTPAPAPAPS